MSDKTKVLVSDRLLSILLATAAAGTAFLVLCAFWYSAKLTLIMTTAGSHMCSW